MDDRAIHHVMSIGFFVVMAIGYLWMWWDERKGAPMQGEPKDEPTRWVLGHEQQRTPPRPKKPKDCTCAYPDAFARNPTRHAQRCPAYKRMMAEIEKDAGEYVPLVNAPDRFGPNVLEDSLRSEPFIVPATPADEAEPTGPIPGRPGQGAKG